MMKKIVLILLCAATVLYSQEIKRPKIGIALSGGGALGLAHIGALKIIDSLKIPIDCIAGTSMGGLVGALLALGYTPAEMEELVTRTDWLDIFDDLPKRSDLPYFEKRNRGLYQLALNLKDFTPVIPSGLISGQKISLLFSSLTYKHESKKNFDELPIPFRCVAVDLISGKEIILKDGSLTKAMRATMSIPTVFNPVEYGDYLLVDGGVLNNFPVNIAKDMGADYVIGLNIVTPPNKRTDYESLLTVLGRTTDIPRDPQVYENIKAADLYIEESTGDYSILDFEHEKIAEIIRKGEDAARTSLDKLIKLKNSMGNYPEPLKKNSETGPESVKRISGVTVVGNESLDVSFVFGLLGINENDVFDTKIISEKISELYGLGYFETINYEIVDEGVDKYHLIINIKEKTKQKLFFGLRYDDFHKLVGAVKIQTTSLFIKGLRTELELQFAGLYKLSGKLFYPSRSLDYPVYPFIQFVDKNSPINIYDTSGAKMAQYADASFLFGGGIGISISRDWDVEFAYNKEFTNATADIAFRDTGYFPDFVENNTRVDISLNFDNLDNLLLPKSGTKLSTIAEISNKKFGSSINYSRLEARLETYLTFSRFHTLCIKGSYFKAWDNVPVYKLFYLGGSNDFIGFDYGQMFGNRFSIVGLEYRYEFKKDIFLKAVYNSAFNYSLGFAEQTPFSRNAAPIHGFGLGVEFQSIVGPLQFIIANGEKTPYILGDRQFYFYTTAGYKF